MSELEALSIDLAQEDLFEFASYTFPQMVETPFHLTYYKLLTDFYTGKIPRLIVSVPPQHGKSQGSSRHGIAWALGQNPDLKTALVSYNHTFASKFNRDVQRIIDSTEYSKVFPNTRINGKNVVTTSSWLRNSEEFEVVEAKGGLKTIGVGGGLTGNTVDVLVMDDLYKDYADATSPTISERVWEWYTTVAKTRLHNNSQELIVFTRWSENDLVGRLEDEGIVHTLKAGEDPIEIAKNQPRDHWIKINFEALKEGEPNELDKREEGQALWEEKHSAEKLEGIRKLDISKFNALYQGNPKSKEGQLYGEDFKTYNPSALPKGAVMSYTDVADTGADFLCSIIYVVSGRYAYVIDVIYSDKKNEITEPLLSQSFFMNNVNIAYIESNNGGRAFCRNVERLSRELGNGGTSFKPFTQSKNKIARILSNSSNVVNFILMPEGWGSKFPKFHKHLTGYLAKGKNAHDDAPDALTGVFEKSLKKWL